jgi:hypothetical protein
VATRRASRLAVVGVLVAAATTAVVAGGRPAAAGVSPGANQRVSVHDDGSQGVGDASASDGGPDDVAVSGDGRYVAFDDPVRLDPLTVSGRFNVYVRDLTAPGHTVLISRGTPPIGTESMESTVSDAPGEAPADGDSTLPSISASGRYVAFQTQATNIPDGDDTLEQNPGTVDIVICDRDPQGTGTLDGPAGYRYIHVGRVDTDDGVRLYDNTEPTISADGTTVSWEQEPVDGDGPTTVVWVVLRHDAAGGLLQPQDADYHDAIDATAADMFQPRLSADGRHIVFLAACPSCPPTDPDSSAEATNVDVEDLATGRTSRVNVGSDGRPLPGVPAEPAVSGDGRTVAFVETTLSGQPQVIAVDRDPVRVTVVSRATDGKDGEGDSPALSADGRYLAFTTNAANMANGVDTGRGGEGGIVRNRQVVVRDLVVDAARESAHLPRLPAELASPSVDHTCGSSQGTSCAGDDDSGGPALSADGAVVAFTSWADDLVSGDTNEAPDAFARRFLPTVTADPVTFGTAPLGTSSTDTAVVREVGFGPVHVTGVTVTGPDAGDFTVFPAETCSGGVLHETDTCLVSLRFAPHATGTRQASLVISQLDGTPSVNVPITGGAGPAVVDFQATPDPLVFPGPQLALSSSGPGVVTVHDAGATPFTVSSVRVLAGPRLFAGDYTILGDGCTGATLPVGGVCQVVVFDTPHGAGDRPGALEFTDSGGVPHVVGLAGSGTTPTVRVSPAVVPAGRVTTVTGTGWPADHSVTLAVAPLPGHDRLTVVTAADGTFSAPLVIFAHTLVGDWPITGTASGTSLTATTSLLVVLGTYQPPDFTTRR